MSALFPFDLKCWYGLPAQGVAVDNWADDNFDHSGLDFIGGGNLWVMSDRRPIAASGMNTFGMAPSWGSQWKAFVKENADRSHNAYIQKTTLPYEDNYLDLDPEVKDRLGMLREGVDIMNQAWTTGSASLDGKHYQVDGAIVRPLPLQQGGIPLWVAGGGEKVTLKIAAKYAAYTNFNGTLDVWDRKSEILRGHCEAIGRDFGSITRSGNFNTIVGETEAEASDRLAAVKARLLPHVGQERADAIEAEYRSSPAFGAVEQVAERLAERERHGLGYAIHYFPEAAYDRSGVQLFEREVVGALA